MLQPAHLCGDCGLVGRYCVFVVCSGQVWAVVLDGHAASSAWVKEAVFFPADVVQHQMQAIGAVGPETLNKRLDLFLA